VTVQVRDNDHTGAFSDRGVEYGVPMPEFGFGEVDLRDEQPVKLSKVISGETFKFFLGLFLGPQLPGLLQ